MDTAKWREVSKELVYKLAKERRIAAADVMTILRFISIGEASLKDESEPKQLKVAS